MSEHSGARTFILGWAAAVGAALFGIVGWLALALPVPAELRIAAGQRGGAYAAIAESYADGLRAQGLEATVVYTEGSIDNLNRIATRSVELALVQGGIAGRYALDAAGDRDSGLVSLGSIFFEPLWLFLRADFPAFRQRDLRGLRIAVGPAGSGTRALALAMLQAIGIAPEDLELQVLSGAAAADALLAGRIDGVAYVSNMPTEGITRLMRAPERARLVDFAPFADAYARLLPYLTPVRLPRGGFSLAEDLPAASLTLMAPAAYVAARDDINPQVASLIAGLMRSRHADRQDFAAEGRFPSILNQDLPIQPDARRYIERGPPWLQSWMSFRSAVLIDRLIVLALPVLTVLLPVLRFAPPLWRWNIERRIWSRYADLARLEARHAAGLTAEARQDVLQRLGRLEQRVAAMRVPGAYLYRVFALRRDIAFLRRRLAAAPAPAPAPAPAAG